MEFIELHSTEPKKQNAKMVVEQPIIYTATEYSTPLVGLVLTIAHEKPCYSVDSTLENYSDSGITSDEDLITLSLKKQEVNPVTTSAAAKNTTNESEYLWLDRIERLLISIRNKTEGISRKIDSNQRINMNPSLDSFKIT